MGDYARVCLQDFSDTYGEKIDPISKQNTVR